MLGLGVHDWVSKGAWKSHLGKAMAAKQLPPAGWLAPVKTACIVHKELGSSGLHAPFPAKVRQLFSEKNATTHWRGKIIGSFGTHAKFLAEGGGFAKKRSEMDGEIIANRSIVPTDPSSFSP
jgi:hypothetical protein